MLGQTGIARIFLTGHPAVGGLSPGSGGPMTIFWPELKLARSWSWASCHSKYLCWGSSDCFVTGLTKGIFCDTNWHLEGSREERWSLLGGAQEMAGEVVLGQLANRSHEQASLQHGEVPKSMMGATLGQCTSPPQGDMWWCFFYYYYYLFGCLVWFWFILLV